MSVWLPILLAIFGVIFGVMVLLVGLLLVAVGWSTLRLSLGQRHWTRVPAEVISGRIEQRTLDDVVNYLPKVRYRYAVQGGDLVSERLSLAEKMYPSVVRARKALEMYPVGATVMASYPPDNPAEAVLVPGGGLAGAAVLMLGLAMVLGPLLVATAAGWPGREIGLGIAVSVLLLWCWSSLWTRRRRRARRDGVLPPPGRGSDADVERLIGLGEKRLAVHLYREIHGTDLKSASQAVADLARRWGA